MSVWNGYRSPQRARESSLDVARRAFELLVAGPNPLAVDGALFPGFPGRLLPLDEVRTRLLDRDCPAATRDRVWAYLVTRAREHGGAWTVGCVGVAMPALTATAAELCAGFAGDRADIDSEILAGFLAALPVVDLEAPAIVLRLRWAAYRAGLAAVRDALATPGVPIEEGFHSAPPRPPWAHPDFVLLRAVADGVISREEADLIGATRLDDISLHDYAAQRGMSYQACKKARLKAEYRLVDYLLDSANDQPPEDDCVTGQLATSVAVARAARGRRRTRPRTVTERQRTRSRRIRKSRSPNRRAAGVRGCGARPAARATESPEVP